MTVAGQAALAIDNARLYQQQKDFSETMQRSLLPSELPDVGGIEVGHVYQSAARVDVGGDVYDFLHLDDGRLAVILGDVTGKGIQAAADMAMAKFSFRALARMHPEPADFLAAANEVVVDEIETGKFITMLYVLLDPESSTVACASAGHPAARVVTRRRPGRGAGGPRARARHRLRPGVRGRAGRARARDDRRPLHGRSHRGAPRRRALRRGAARRPVAPPRELGAQELAEAVLADCKSFAGGELSDDCAVVCLRLSP